MLEPRLRATVKEFTGAALVARSGPKPTCLADVEPQAVEWLWPGRVALGRMTMLVGNPGEGKSLVSTDMAARVSTGTAWRDGGACPQGSVILMAAEDGVADVIRPRLDAHGADVSYVHLLSSIRPGLGADEDERLISLKDVEAIEDALSRLPNSKLIVVDPIGSFIGGRTNAHRDNEVRAVLAPVAMLAEKHGVAVLVVMHRRKCEGGSADDSALGSRAFTGIARNVWHLFRDTRDASRRLMLSGKNNLAPEGSGLAFSIVGDPPRVCWERDPLVMSADEALVANASRGDGKRGPRASARHEAEEFLLAELEHGPRPQAELADEWTERHGGSPTTLNRAKSTLGVKSFQPKTPGPWSWRLPGDKDAKAPNEMKPDDLGNLAKSTGDLTNTGTSNSTDAVLSNGEKPDNLGDLAINVGNLPETIDSESKNAKLSEAGLR